MLKNITKFITATTRSPTKAEVFEKKENSDHLDYWSHEYQDFIVLYSEKEEEIVESVDSPVDFEKLLQEGKEIPNFEELFEREVARLNSASSSSSNTLH